MRRFVAVALVAGAVVAATATPAHAALWLIFSTTRAEPGDSVTVRTGGSAALANIPDAGLTPLRVFLAPSAAADATSPRDSRLIALGELAVDRKGDGHLRFQVPDVPGGEYTTFLHCVPCAPYSGGRALVPVGPYGAGDAAPFVVVRGDGGRYPVAVLAAGVAGVSLLGAALWARRVPSG